MKTQADTIRDFVQAALQQQPTIDRDVLFDHIAAELGKQRDNALNRSIGVVLSWMFREGQIAETKRGEITLPALVATNGNGNGHGRQPLEARTIVQRNGERDRVELSRFMLQRDPRAVTLESSPVLVEEVIRVELCIGGYWLEIDSEGGLRICVGNEKPAWAPEELT